MHIANTSGGIQILVLHLDLADNIYESEKHHFYKNIVKLRIQVTCPESRYVDIKNVCQSCPDTFVQSCPTDVSERVRVLSFACP